MDDCSNTWFVKSIGLFTFALDTWWTALHCGLIWLLRIATILSKATDNPITALMAGKETAEESMMGLYLNGHDSYHDASFWIPHLAMKQHTFPQNSITVLTVSWITNNHDWSQNKVNGQNQICKSIGISFMLVRHTIFNTMCFHTEMHQTCYLIMCGHDKGKPINVHYLKLWNGNYAKVLWNENNRLFLMI